jgi:hypothetical protein
MAQAAGDDTPIRGLVTLQPDAQSALDSAASSACHTCRFSERSSMARLAAR